MNPVVRRSVVVVGLVAALVLASILGLRVGAVNLTVSQVVDGMFAGDSLIITYRLPRIVVGAMAGVGMAVAGSLLQVGLRNPLAAPDTMGITAGGGLAAVAALLGAGTLPAQYLTIVAFVGATVGATLVVVLARHHMNNPIPLTLTGVAVSMGLAAVTQLLLVRAAPEAGAAMTWLKGSLYARSMPDALVVAPVILCGFVLAICVSRHLDTLTLTDASMRGIGSSPKRWRVIALAISIMTGAAAVAAAGVIGFVGLIVPHLARLLVGGSFVIRLPVAALVGAILVVTCDALGRWLFSPTEIPVGALVAIVGAPYFIVELFRRWKV